ncbi:hypothetical protein IKE83_01330 [Candidatus Saccharibacteria bacterium]|nr:hypothetical protein [Candidatus Saccharibacteria bacterium]
MKTNFKTKFNQTTDRVAKAKFTRRARRIGNKYHKGNYRSAGRSADKSEIRYRILENTMRGYFNYSI